MAGYDKSKDADYTLAVQAALKTLGADLGAGGVDGKWGRYTESAYQKNRSAVDALVAGMAQGGYTPLQAVQVDVPEQKSFDQWLSLGQALYAAQAEAQKRSVQRQLEYNRQQVEQNRVQSAATLENAANARGFGRSSYTTDMMQRNENTAQQNQTLLLNNFSDALLRIEADHAANAAEYAGSMWKSQQDAVMQALKFNAQMQQEVNLKNWQKSMEDREQMLKTYTSVRSSRSSGRKKKQESAQALGSSVLNRGIQALKSGMNHTKTVSGMNG